MKYIMICLATFTCFCNFNCKTSKASDSIVIATDKNDKKPSVNKDVAGFLVKIADARMMGKKEGELAGQKGTTPEIVAYGKLMIKDQEFLLTQIKKLAAERSITLPAEISNDKKDGFEDLQAKTEKDFDKKFIKMMRIDHERDIKDFTKAGELTDKGVTDFAAKYIGMIQMHLDKLNAIKE
jgi:putative membrane protein